MTLTPDVSNALEPIFEFGWKKMGDALDKSVGAVWRRVEWKRAANAYLTKIRDLHGTTRVMGKSVSMSLERVFTQVYIWDEPEAARYLTVEALEAAFRTRTRLAHQGLQRTDGLQLAQNSPYLFIVGKPGAGKTTFLKKVTLMTTKRGLPNALPIFISLKEMADSGRTLLQQMVYELDVCQFPNAEPFIVELLKAHKVLVLLDGLDEVQSEGGRQRRVLRDIRDFVKRYDRNHYMITCRAAAVSYTFEKFKYVEVSDFQDEQIDDYITRYFAEDKATGEACLMALHTPEHQALRELAGSPLLLSLLCLNYERSHTFPARQVDLYEQALQALLNKWDESRDVERDDPYKQLTLPNKRRLYMRLAYENFKKGRYFISTRALAKQVEQYTRSLAKSSGEELDGESLLKAMEQQHGIVVERAQQVHAFAHLTFQEYYAAKYIAESDDMSLIESLLRYVVDPRWREVIKLTVSLLNEEEETAYFFTKFLEATEREVLKDEITMQVVRHAMARQSLYGGISLGGRWWTLWLLVVFRNAMMLGRATHALVTRSLYTGRARSLERRYELEQKRGTVRDMTREFALVLDHSTDLVQRLATTLERSFKQITGVSDDFDLDVALLGSLARSVQLPPVAALGMRLDTTLVILAALRLDGEYGDEILMQARDRALGLGLNALADDIAALTLPPDLEDEAAWGTFHAAIATLAQEHRALPLEHIRHDHDTLQMTNYVNVNRLLVECMTLAHVQGDEREAIMATMLSLPAPADP